MNWMGSQLEGIGMTSQRTRNRLVQRLHEQGISNDAVLQTMAQVPRHLFVDEALSHRAYEDTALPIGHGQTISQPYTVALMTQLVLQDAGSGYSVLEVGTGCGYQTAILAHLFQQVYSIERIRALHESAKRRIQQLQLYNVEFRHTDGTGGWPNSSYSFDRILMAAACDEFPEKLFAQLKTGGIMVFPLDNGSGQQLIRACRNHQGMQTEVITDVSFVPLLQGTR